MNYWRGFMDWPIKPDWLCEVCGEYKGLTWGLVHAQCRCNNCHAVYTMRDGADKVVDTPISQLKDEYRAPAIAGFKKFQIPLSKFTEQQWAEVMA